MAERPAGAGTPAAEAPDGRVYFPGLDGLRAVAIALVYGFHDHRYDLWSYAVSCAEAPAALLLDPALHAAGLPGVSLPARLALTRPVADNGWVGVDVFFVLSGFLIATLLLRERENSGRVDLRAFWIRRALRIWPLYYLVVAVAFGLLPAALQGISWPRWRSQYGGQLPAFLAFLGNWSMVRAGPPSDAVSVLWSVCVEEQFYLLVPLFVAFLGPRWRAPAVVALIAAAVANRYQMTAAGVTGVAYRYDSRTHVDTLLSGVLLALVARRAPGLVRSGWPWRLAVVAGCLLLMLVTLDRGGPWRSALDPVLIWSWSVALVVVAADPCERWSAVLRLPAVVWLGKISYGLYLFHMIALALVDRLAVRLPPFDDRRLILALLGPALTLALASASYSLYERPFLLLKRRWTRVPSRPLDPPPRGPS